ncbi:ribosomal protein S15 [Ehrlichia chaffeensis str. Heartland]|uniref:Small ribosomal subunit protein uS15 n=1 Tax=Ehrlichia chaffeensis (strain ATCC CRL-10679 / Arkansas) TaxID=205920 RepID=RS15_EHRCR|nr:30S ribosomal protein S15 [Ehrlichia chaffeensis]Q2GGA3.1 RecName: Full=Small ribosomal subunit protein uS15; AltName: Full=30S ribosomal protein S15 [Ehrlichia chaffeensis str. Arkansas]ABD44901.1 ribosomal protein S15 [Ehrlichia chaffeensis str. Arkansas]AHX03796.1 ribosomal protein S15 [Ehrlichia chaffeensis str. Heartland]AHX05478.1 ribosomal protein S15 [Ehrlichia chaffeensis str. Jax]AHX06466.1 ribosomal protein S15 [Ehrlichia chaffeensis str. Liberty]AHX07087.1 ribosomal protein S15
MSITRERKSELISEYCLKKDDTGSSFVQCAILSERIRNLTEHLKVHKKDFHCRRGLMVLVCRRRNVLQYVRKKYGDSEYLALIKRLGIRDIFH